MERLTRKNVAVDETWDLSDLFAMHAQWEAELSAIERDLSSVTVYKGRLSEGASTLAACLDAQERMHTRLTRVTAYASMRLATDTTDTQSQADSTQASTLGARVGTALSFIRSEIGRISLDTLAQWMDACSALAAHRYLLDDLARMRPFTLSPETEHALSMLRETLAAPHRIYSLGKGADIKFTPAKDAQGNLHAVYDGGPLIAADPVLRRAAHASFGAGLAAHRNTFAATFATEVQNNVALAQVRGYPSTTAMLLHPHKVTQEVYDAVLDVIFTEVAPHMRRFQRLRQRLLGLDHMLYCDLTAPVPEGSVVSFAQAQAWILEALSVLGEEYHAIIRDAFAKRWIDRADNAGKRNGAFCNTVYGVHAYVFMTWADQMRPVFTLAHELGHAGHLMLAGRYQRHNHARPTTSFIEAPSTMNELLLAQYLLGRSHDKAMRTSVLLGLMGTYHHNFVNHLLEGQLQRRIYHMAEKRIPITEKVLTESKGDILSTFWEDTVTIDETARLLWMRQQHYYMGLYPYTYALGLSISTAAAKAISEEGQPAIDRWLSVLKAGGTRSPVELAAMAGVDITDPATFKTAADYVGSLVDELERSVQ
ncbi:MAG: oligoendopeptidase F [Firmicutes bacterium]|nr:oligoendopeptidase F [Bacillota bacterium]